MGGGRRDSSTETGKQRNKAFKRAPLANETILKSLIMGQGQQLSVAVASPVERRSPFGGGGTVNQGATGQITLQDMHFACMPPHPGS